MKQIESNVCTGMFVSWMILNGLISDKHKKEALPLLVKLVQKEITGLDFIKLACGGSLTTNDFNTEGKLFAEYYLLPASKIAKPLCIVDCLDTFKKSITTIENTWSNYQVVKPVIASRFIVWRETRSRA